MYWTELIISAGTPPVDQVPTCDDSIILTVAPFKVQITQGLEGFSAAFSLWPYTEAEGGGAGQYLLTLTIKRDGTIKFFAVVMYIGIPSIVLDYALS